MPLYEFVCEACEQEFEKLVASANWRGATCPHCGSKKLQKKLSVFASSAGSPSSGPMPCDTGGCPVPPRKRTHSAGCGCCRPGR
jgi:putative FmdB family regulatory protein